MFWKKRINHEDYRKEQDEKKKQMKNIRVPREQLKYTPLLSAFKEGDFGYVSSSFILYDQDDFLWIWDYSNLSRERTDSENVKVTKLKEGFEIDISKCDRDEWCRRDFSFNKICPVISLKGLEQWKKNVEKIKEEQKQRKLKKQEILNKLSKEERVILGFNSK